MLLIIIIWEIEVNAIQSCYLDVKYVANCREKFSGEKQQH